MECEFLSDIVHGVFPSGSTLAPTPSDVAPTRHFLVLSGSNGPRWVIPENPGLGWPFLKQWQPYKRASRLAWPGLTALYRFGLAGRIPGVRVIGITVGGAEDWSHAGWAYQAPPVPVIYVGTLGETRKAVAGLVVAGENRVAMVAKFPLGEAARQANLMEAGMLDRLAAEKPGLAPRLLFSNPDSGITAQEPLPGVPSGRKLTEAHLAWLLNMAVAGETVSLREVATELARGLEGIDLPDREMAATMETALSMIDASTPLPAVWVHGDFVPWNLKHGKGGALAAIDWEDARPRGLPLFDLVYFHSMQVFLFGDRWSFPGSLEPFLGRYAEALSIDRAVLGKVVLGCLATDWLRCAKRNSVKRALFLHRIIKEQLECVR